MTNAITVPPGFNGQVATVFQGQQAGDDMSGGITGGYGLLKYRGKVWSIQHNGNSMTLMREDGDGPRGSVDLVILKANPMLSKTYYENGWDENSNNPPDCASANGVVPDAGVPKKQSDVCAMCPKNAWGSAPGGGKGKACGDHRRLAVVPLADIRNETLGGALLLRCPAASLQDMAAFDSRYKQLGYPYFTMGIKIGFDPQESYPKFVFNAIRPLTEDEARMVIEMRNSAETARVVNEGNAPAPVQAAPSSQGAFLEAPPANAVQPQQVSPSPAGGAPAAAPQPTQPQPAPVQPVQPVANGNAGSAGGFGPVATGTVTQAQPAPASVPTQPAPVPQPAAAASAGQPAPAQAAPAPAAPQRAMTGFGNVTPEVTPQAAPQATQAAPQGPAPGPAPAATQATAPGTVAALEGSIDDRLSALLNG